MAVNRQSGKSKACGETRNDDHRLYTKQQGAGPHYSNDNLINNRKTAKQKLIIQRRHEKTDTGGVGQALVLLQPHVRKFFPCLRSRIDFNGTKRPLITDGVGQAPCEEC